MPKKAKGLGEFCQKCGKTWLSREQNSFDPTNESHGRTETCDVCGTTWWIPGDPLEPIEKMIDYNIFLGSNEVVGKQQQFGNFEAFSEFVTQEWNRRKQ